MYDNMNISIEIETDQGKKQCSIITKFEANGFKEYVALVPEDELQEIEEVSILLFEYKLNEEEGSLELMNIPDEEYAAVLKAFDIICKTELN